MKIMKPIPTSFLFWKNKKRIEKGFQSSYCLILLADNGDFWFFST